MSVSQNSPIFIHETASLDCNLIGYSSHLFLTVNTNAQLHMSIIALVDKQKLTQRLCINTSAKWNSEGNSSVA